MENNFTLELIEQARQAKSPEALLTLAEANGMTLTQDEARDYFAQLHEPCNQSGELSDEELNNVAGGGCHYKDGRLIVTIDHYCSDSFWRCKRCHGHAYYRQSKPDAHTCYDGKGISHLNCNNCQFMVYEHGLWLCNNPKFAKK